MTRVLRVISVVCSSENDSRKLFRWEWSFRVHTRKVGQFVD